MRWMGRRLATCDQRPPQTGGVSKMIATFGQMYGNPGLQAMMKQSDHTGGMVIVITTEIEKEEERSEDRELSVTDATAKGTPRETLERGAQDLEEAVMNHLGLAKKVVQKTEGLKIKRPPKSEIGGTKIGEGTVDQSGIGIEEPEPIWIRNGWRH